MVNLRPLLICAFRLVLVLLAAAAGVSAAQAQAPAPVPRPMIANMLTLQAIYAGTGKPITSDVEWRIYSLRGTESELVSSSALPNPQLSLSPGEYLVHVSYGLATGTKRLNMPANAFTDRVPVNAGGLIVRGKLADAPLPEGRQGIAVFIPTATDSEAKLVTNKLQPGELLRLPEGTYHVVSTYAGSNSVSRADISLQSGRVTEATLNHRAASMTLKLVRQAGGVALANTSWIVQTPGGDIIREAIGAFPTMELAEGEYEVIARNDEREFKEKMKVVAGVNRDFEVVVK